MIDLIIWLINTINNTQNAAMMLIVSIGYMLINIYGLFNCKIIGSGSIWSKCNSACYLIDDKILVDIPNGICKALLNQGINFRNIANVLITHFHGDHYFDVPFYLLSKLKSDDKKVNFYLSDEGINKIKDVINLAFPNTYNTIFSVVDLLLMINLR